MNFSFSPLSYLFLSKPIPQNSKGLIFKVVIEYPWGSENFWKLLNKETNLWTEKERMFKFFLSLTWPLERFPLEKTAGFASCKKQHCALRVSNFIPWIECFNLMRIHWLGALSIDSQLGVQWQILGVQKKTL